jgi:hypothetical protein
MTFSEWRFRPLDERMNHECDDYAGGGGRMLVASVARVTARSERRTQNRLGVARTMAAAESRRKRACRRRTIG